MVNNKNGNKDALKILMIMSSCKTIDVLLDSIIKCDNANDLIEYKQPEIQNTVLYRLLNLNDLTQYYLLFIYFYEYSMFPEEIFFSGNQSYLIKNELFSIKWILKPKNFIKYIEIFETLLKSWPSEKNINLSDQHLINNESFFVLLINFIELGKFLPLKDIENKIDNLINIKNNISSTNIIMLKYMEYQFDKEKV